MTREQPPMSSSFASEILCGIHFKQTGDVGGLNEAYHMEHGILMGDCEP